MRYPAALEIIRAQAKEARKNSTSYDRNPRWWQFLWQRPAFRVAVAELQRFIAGGATAKRVVFVWCEKHWRPSNSTNMFTLASDYAMGVRTSRIHLDWAISESSTMRVDPRYTTGFAVDTYPWPKPTHAQRAQIATLSRELIRAATRSLRRARHRPPDPLQPAGRRSVCGIPRTARAPRSRSARRLQLAT